MVQVVEANPQGEAVWRYSLTFILLAVFSGKPQHHDKVTTEQGKAHQRQQPPAGAHVRRNALEAFQG